MAAAGPAARWRRRRTVTAAGGAGSGVAGGGGGSPSYPGPLLWCGGWWGTGMAAQLSPGWRQRHPQRSRVRYRRGPDQGNFGKDVGGQRLAGPLLPGAVPRPSEPHAAALGTPLLPWGSWDRRPPGPARLCCSLPGERRPVARRARGWELSPSGTERRKFWKSLLFGRRCRGKVSTPGGCPAPCLPRRTRGAVSAASRAGRGLRGHGGT